MPPSQHFWRLLLGDDVVSELFVEKTAATARGRELAHNAESRGRRASQESQNEARSPGSAEFALHSDDTNVRRASKLGIDCFLQMAGDELCKQPVSVYERSN